MKFQRIQISITITYLNVYLSTAKYPLLNYSVVSISNPTYSVIRFFKYTTYYLLPKVNPLSINSELSYKRNKNIKYTQMLSNFYGNIQLYIHAFPRACSKTVYKYFSLLDSPFAFKL